MDFSAEQLALPSAKADAALHGVLERHATDLLSRLPSVNSLADRVRELLVKELSHGNPSLETVAEALHMSPRTLNRRLKDEGTTHKAVADSLRRELSERYLKDPSLAISEVAFLLGFSDATAFHRAFKRWMGMTPAEFRAQG